MQLKEDCKILLKWSLKSRNMNLQVLLSVMDLKKDDLDKMNIASKCVVINQCDKDGYEKYKNFDIYSYTERGAANSRNRGLEHITEDIIFEEFMSRNEYISNESNKLMFLYSTVDRKRHKVKLWLAGNTVSRVCPYIQDWDLLKTISTQKQGTIKEVIIDGVDDEKIKIAIEYCKSTGQSSGTIGTNAEMINTGAWETAPQPHLPKSYKFYDILFRFGF